MVGKTLFRLLGAYAKLDLTWFLRDMKSCLLQIITDAAVSVAGVTGMLLLAERLEGFMGYTRPELLFMLGCAILADGVYALLFFNNNAAFISRVIGRGQLDHALVMPVPLLLHFLTNGIAPVSGCGPFLSGLALTGYAVFHLPSGSLIPLWAPVLALLLVLSCVILMAWIYGVSSLAFWAPYAAEEIAPEVRELFSSLAPYPLGGFSKALQLIFCSLLPVGSMAWLPSAILLHKTPMNPALLVMIITAAATALIAMQIFRKGLNHYARYSCPRYTGFGR